MTEMSIALQSVKVRALKCAWDNACAKFDRTGTLPALLDMTAAMKEYERYDPYQAVNVRPFDAECEDYLDCQDPRRN